jgi:hypothetical protein
VSPIPFVVLFCAGLVAALAIPPFAVVRRSLTATVWIALAPAIAAAAAAAVVQQTVWGNAPFRGSEDISPEVVLCVASIALFGAGLAGLAIALAVWALRRR